MEKLFSHQQRAISPHKQICIVRVHNEESLIGGFIDHYRKMGDVSFLVIDDRSTDRTPEILKEQPDVIVFHPAVTSHYRDDKRIWVEELLNKYCMHRWALCVDVDEHLIYKNMERKSVHCLVADLEQQGADSFPAIMLDMYDNSRLSEHTFSGGDLKRAFPFFDDPSTYRVEYKRGGRMFRASGGMRHRLFSKAPGRNLKAGLRLRLNGRHSRIAMFGKRKSDQIVRNISNCFNTNQVYRPNSLKTPLLFWTPGMTWDEHSIREVRKQSDGIGAILHFKMAKGVEGLEYIAERGQHYGDSLYAKWILSTVGLSNLNPYCSFSKRFTGSSSVFGEVNTE